MIAVEELVGRTLTTRNEAHMAHWRTKSYAQHVALGEFYDGLLASIDELVEAYQGAFDLIGRVELAAPSADGIVQQMEADLLWISQNRDGVSRGVPALDNILQALEAVYLKALYKLRNLS